jgi:hypothetical protein
MGILAAAHHQLTTGLLQLPAQAGYTFGYKCSTVWPGTGESETGFGIIIVRKDVYAYHLAARSKGTV